MAIRPFLAARAALPFLPIASLNVEPAASNYTGLSLRAAPADGPVEPYDGIDIDLILATGRSIDGRGRDRKGATVGIGAIVNGIAAEHRPYLAAGGLGALIGGGQLPNYDAEATGEAWYKPALGNGIEMTADYRLVGKPGYNRDRDPAYVVAPCLHGAV